MSGGLLQVAACFIHLYHSTHPPQKTAKNCRKWGSQCGPSKLELQAPDGAAYAAAAINILDGPTVNHHRLREHAGVFTDYVTLIIYEGTPFIELILQRSCTYSGPTSNGIGPLVQRRVIRR